MKIKKPQMIDSFKMEDFKNLVNKNIEQSETLIEGYLFQDQIIEYEEFDKMEIQGCCFKNCKFLDCNFLRSSWVDILFQSCDFSNSNFSEGSFHRIEWYNCKLLGTDCSEMHIRDCKMTECFCDYLNLTKGNIDVTSFIDCQMKQSFFTNCKLKVEFQNCNLLASHFEGTKLKGLDFRTCQTEAISAGLYELSGAVFQSMQAIDLAKLLGIVIRD